MSNVSVESNNQFDVILLNALKVPGVKVDRDKFLNNLLSDSIKDKEIVRLAIDKNTIDAGIDAHTLNKIAKSLISKRTTQTTTASFAAGIPGGLAMAATIPMDTLQFFGTALRLAQELAYLYGYEDLWKGNEIDDEKVKGELTLFLGVMFGVGGSASALRLVSSNLSKQALKKLPQKALTKTFYYPIIKKTASIIGIKVTKDSFAKSVSKAIPILGGVVSGGITYASMKPMGNRLNKVLNESITNYTDKDLERDLRDIENEIVDVDYKEVDIEDIAITTEYTQESSNSFSVADELLKFKELLDAGLITREEFDMKKEELMK
ncbi:SHOCT domain-containing protein [Romboutsia lituseburensis]|uniref:SHOCT domain-containing protein n=1 Tax=Romboutsia lituseburensis TaxID=1537 RepID=UPI00215A67F2|nr:SHOCT domain-containing protein [Romboutsia lituseburensis]MCR8746233.1 SHOCT domain-containing protein [Romboutsia lituseburensis]